MYLQHFGLRHAPLGKEITDPWDDGVLAHLEQRFDWLLNSPGLGLLTGEPGVGKTVALRSMTGPLNPHRYHGALPSRDRLRPHRHLPRTGSRAGPGA